MKMIKDTAANIFMGNWKATEGETITSEDFSQARRWQAGAATAAYLATKGVVGGLGLNASGFPDVLFNVGPIPLPLYKVQYFEVGRSQDLLQYRAVGGEFLAQQKGGNLAVRIDLTLTGVEQNVMLSMLQGLRIWSTAESTYHEWDKVKDESSLHAKRTQHAQILGTIPSDPLYIYGYTPATKTAVPDIPTIANSGTKFSPNWRRDHLAKPTMDPNDPSKTKYNYRITREVDSAYTGTEANMQLYAAKNSNMTLVAPDDYSWARETWHRTFTVTTREEMLFDMYIETLSYRRTVKDGSKVIEVNLFLRRFTPSDPIDINNTKFVVYKKNRLNGSSSYIDGDDSIGFKRQVVRKKKVGVYTRKDDSKVEKIKERFSSNIAYTELGLVGLHRSMTYLFKYGFAANYQDYKDRKLLSLGIGDSI